MQARMTALDMKEMYRILLVILDNLNQILMIFIIDGLSIFVDQVFIIQSSEDVSILLLSFKSVKLGWFRFIFLLLTIFSADKIDNSFLLFQSCVPPPSLNIEIFFLDSAEYGSSLFKLQQQLESLQKYLKSFENWWRGELVPVIV